MVEPLPKKLQRVAGIYCDGMAAFHRWRGVGPLFKLLLWPCVLTLGVVTALLNLPHERSHDWAEMWDENIGKMK